MHSLCFWLRHPRVWSATFKTHVLLTGCSGLSWYWPRYCAQCLSWDLNGTSTYPSTQLQVWTQHITHCGTSRFLPSPSVVSTKYRGHKPMILSTNCTYYYKTYQNFQESKKKYLLQLLCLLQLLAFMQRLLFKIFLRGRK